MNKLKEEPVSVANAQSDKLAVCTVNLNNEIDLILYSPRDLLLAMNLVVNRRDSTNKFKNFGPKVMSLALKESRVILGIFNMRSIKGTNDECFPKGTKEVQRTAAEQGYGPLLYDLGLSFAYPNYVMPDRSSVSPAAKGVWDYYLNYREDVDRFPLGLSIDCGYLPTGANDKIINLTAEKEDLETDLEYAKKSLNYKHKDIWDTEYSAKDIKKMEKKIENLDKQIYKFAYDEPLSYAYKIKNPHNLKVLVNNHVKTFGIVNKYLSNQRQKRMKQREFQERFALAELDFFNGKY